MISAPTVPGHAWPYPFIFGRLIFYPLSVLTHWAAAPPALIACVLGTAMVLLPCTFRCSRSELEDPVVGNPVRQGFPIPYEYWEVFFSLVSLFYIGNFCRHIRMLFSCRYLAEVGLRHLGLPVPNLKASLLQSEQAPWSGGSREIGKRRSWVVPWASAIAIARQGGLTPGRAPSKAKDASSWTSLIEFLDLLSLQKADLEEYFSSLWALPREERNASRPEKQKRPLPLEQISLPKSLLSAKLGQVSLRNEEAAQRVGLGARYPADVQADNRADVQAQKLWQTLEILELRACQCRHPWPEGADVHDLKGVQETLVRKKADLSCSIRQVFTLATEKLTQNCVFWIRFPKAYTCTLQVCPNELFAGVSSHVAPKLHTPNLHLHFWICFGMKSV